MVSTAEFLDHKAWDPAWHECICCFAGRLDDPSPLFKILSDESKDDCFRHRLALAAATQ